MGVLESSPHSFTQRLQHQIPLLLLVVGLVVHDTLGILPLPITIIFIATVSDNIGHNAKECQFLFWLFHVKFSQCSLSLQYRNANCKRILLLMRVAWKYNSSGHQLLLCISVKFNNLFTHNLLFNANSRNMIFLLWILNNMELPSSNCVRHSCFG